ncbi:MAG: leucine-rich repeat domain-containing protein [Clostridia bacterium]|nr:leucine-rich repeat domain-containing protein [Clostridia bacterium]
MKQKKLILLFLWAIMLCMTLFMLSSCLDLDDEDKTLVNVSLENVPTEAIDIGKFDEQTEVFLRLDYDDNSVTKERITQAFFGEENQHYFEEVGTHELEIKYQGFTIKFAVTFKDPIKYFSVEFLNVSDEVVSEQTVKEGENAVAPTEEEMYVEGWRFLGTYDKSFDEVEEDLIVKGEYVKTWNVSFYNNNNELIKSYIVDDKESSPEPTEEERAVEGYTFLSWDRTFDEITKDRTVYGIYQKVKESTSDEYFTFTYLSETDSYERKAKDVNNMPAEVILPSTHEGKPITSIGDRAFYWCRSLTSIELPSNVTIIGNYAFWSCASLTSIELPSSVTYIGDLAFANCFSFTSREIPSNVTSIGSAAFANCRSLTSVKF